MEEKRKNQRRKHYLNNRDLLVIAVLGGAGGVMSTYVGYLANLINRMLGVPFGAGQFVSGLHVFWIILAAGLVKRPGVAVTAGLLKGVVELLTGSSHGVAIVLVSLVQGLLVEIVLLITRRYNLISYMLAGGIAAASNVLVFQLLYFSGAPPAYITFISVMALISGILLGGSLGYSILEIVIKARPIRISGITGEAPADDGVPAGDKQTPGTRFIFAVTLFLVVLLSAGAVYYYAVVYEPPWVGPRCRVEGAVEKTLDFRLSRFAQYETTITAELQGDYSYVPPQEYTGVPLRVILRAASPLDGAKKLEITATDGYTVEFELREVMNDDRMLLIREGDTLRLIAGNYPGGHWVKMVNKIILK